MASIKSKETQVICRRRNLDTTNRIHLSIFAVIGRLAPVEDDFEVALFACVSNHPLKVFAFFRIVARNSVVPIIADDFVAAGFRQPLHFGYLVANFRNVTDGPSALPAPLLPSRCAMRNVSASCVDGCFDAEIDVLPRIEPRPVALTLFQGRFP